MGSVVYTHHKMKIHLFNSQKVIPVRKAYWQRLVKEVALFEGQAFAEVSLHFVEGEEIGRLHAEYFDDPSITDCISFPIDGPDTPYRVLGEVFVCPEVAVDYAAHHKENPLKETALYVVHGLLHLFGYDDIKEKERRQMKKKESELMSYLAAKGFF